MQNKKNYCLKKNSHSTGKIIEINEEPRNEIFIFTQHEGFTLNKIIPNLNKFFLLFLFFK